MNEVHDEVGKFTLEKETHVACVHAEVKLDHATPTNAGALLPWSTWEGSRYDIPTWATRWTVDACATYVVVAVDLEIPAKKAPCLTA